MAHLRVMAAYALLCLGALWFSAYADETSSGDKRRILYSNSFTFMDDGYPLVTIGLMEGQDQVHLAASRGKVIVRPDGDGGSEIVGGRRWHITTENVQPGVIREWVVVASREPGDHRGVELAMTQWKQRGFQPATFEVGTVFGVDGEVIDSRELLVAVSPMPVSKGKAKARAIARRYRITERIHREVVQRPRGLIVARSGNIVIRNQSVIWFSPVKRSDTLSLQDVEVGGGGSQLHIKHETRRYFGSIYVTLGNDGKLVAVNAVSADKLLAGLVPSEIYPDAAEHALSAQAIAARTELLQKIGTRHLTDPYLLCSTQHCQVYAGAGKEHPRTTRAVQNTRGQVLLRDTGGLVDARYSAACGGHGEHNDHIWGGTPDPALRGHLDAPVDRNDLKPFVRGIDASNIDAFLTLPGKSSYCGSTRYGKGRFRWNKHITAEELARRVAKHYPRVGRIRALEPLSRGVSGRINALKIRGDDGEVTATGDVHIRRLLGGLRSTLFTVKPTGDRINPDAFEFRGAGFGHGVGMCQIGAIGMAESGLSYTTILGHYYPGSRIKRLY